MPELTITLGIIVLTCLVSWLALRDQRIFENLLFAPFQMYLQRDWFRFLTHGFVHGGFMHLFINMYVLYMFGNTVEQQYGALSGNSGALPFILLYIGGIVLSSLPGYFKHRHDPAYRAVGASGATSAVVFSFILMNPTNKLFLILIPIPIAAWLFGLLYLGYEWYMSKRGNDGIAHDAHYFGALYGIAFTAVLDQHSVGAFMRAVFPTYL
ncbi:MAG TPA: rhomboid family intramembrane serine protease [Flavobacteriales bacterium]